MNDYKEPFDLEKLMPEMMQEIILLKAAIETQKVIIELLISQQQHSIRQELFPEFYQRCFQAALNQLSTEHTWYEGYWKEVLSQMLGKPPSAE